MKRTRLTTLTALVSLTACGRVPLTSTPFEAPSLDAQHYHVLAVGMLPIVSLVVDSGTPSAAIDDGNVATAWNNGGYRNATATVVAGLGGPAALADVRLKTGPTAADTSYDVQVSADGTTWVTALAAQTNTTWNEETKVLPAGTVGRAVRILWHNSAKAPQPHFALYELAIDGRLQPSAGPSPSVAPSAPPGLPGPAVPSVKPGQPATGPAVPSAKPGQPATGPAVPSAKPGQPATGAAVPSASPGRPATGAAMPSAFPGQPATGAAGPVAATPGLPATGPVVPSATPGSPLPPATPGLPATGPAVPSAAPSPTFTPPGLTPSPVRLVSAPGGTVACTSGASALADGDPATVWTTTSSSSSWAAVPLTGAAQGTLLVAWDSSGFTYLNNAAAPRNYTLLVSSDSTNGSNGSWRPAKVVTDNPLRSRVDTIQAPGARWVRLQTDMRWSFGPALRQLAVYAPSAAAATRFDSWLILGDSITAQAFDPSLPQTFTQTVARNMPGWAPILVGGGTGGDAATDGQLKLAAALPLCPPGSFIGIAYGTNDGTRGITPASFRATLEQMVQSILASGRTPMLARTCHDLNGSLPAYVAAIDALTIAYHLPPGPDLYTWFKNHPEQIGPDSVHPTAAGDAAIQQLWGEAVARAYAAP